MLTSSLISFNILGFKHISLKVVPITHTSSPIFTSTNFRMEISSPAKDKRKQLDCCYTGRCLVTDDNTNTGQPKSMEIQQPGVGTASTNLGHAHTERRNMISILTQDQCYNWTYPSVFSLLSLRSFSSSSTCSSTRGRTGS